MNTKTKPRFGVIASIMDTRPIRALQALPKASNATSIEIRLDSLWGKLHDFLAPLTEILPNKPIILTLRSAEQGGGTKISLMDQWGFWARLPRKLESLIVSGNVFVDWSLDLIGYHLQERKPQLFPWEKIGASEHCFTETPQDLPDLLKDLEATPARAFLKLVSIAKSPEDVERIRSLFVDRKDPRPLIAFAMGPIGRESRFQCLKWGSAGTYGFIFGHSMSAPGQVTVAELLEHPDVKAILN